MLHTHRHVLVFDTGMIPDILGPGTDGKGAPRDRTPIAIVACTYVVAQTLRRTLVTDCTGSTSGFWCDWCRWRDTGHGGGGWRGCGGCRGDATPVFARQSARAAYEHTVLMSKDKLCKCSIKHQGTDRSALAAATTSASAEDKVRRSQEVPPSPASLALVLILKAATTALIT